MVSKVLIALLPKYAIRVFSIQELKCITGNDLTLEDLVGRLASFGLDNFVNHPSENIETTFNAKLTIDDSKDRYKKKKKQHVDNDNNRYDEDIEELKALLAKRFHRGKGKYKGKMPIICFNCNEIGHIAARCK